jgi:hypothetical protein
MPEFKTKEEYEKWKKERIQNIQQGKVKFDHKKGSLETSAEFTDKFSVGKYIAGLSHSNSSSATCFVSETDFIFKSTFGIEMGRIPRDSVNSIFIEKKSSVTQRLTATRMLTLGIFSLAAPKKREDNIYCLVIDWDDQQGVTNNTIFEFSGPLNNITANGSLSSLKKYLLPKGQILKPDEKKCPYCAETIKKEAVFCKHCNKDLTAS